jgi:hypothetical protein
MYVWCTPVYTAGIRIRIESDPDPYGGRHPVNADPDLVDPDRRQFQTSEKVDKLNFFQKISICCSKY